MKDTKLFALAGLLLVLPLTLGFFGHDQFRYPCQDPKNWDSDQCKFPICDVTRTCPEHIFKGQRDPRLGPPAPEQQLEKAQGSEVQNKSVLPSSKISTGAKCGK
jgi:hypothetical protein